jgi:cation:H+ antiporter
MMWLNLLLVALGIGLLTAGGEALIRGALAAARRLGISPLLSGLVIIGFGTSAPELAVSIDAAINGNPDIAVGNLIGSNISNIMRVLGICALVAPMVVKPQVLRRDAFSVVAASVLFLVLGAGAGLGRMDGIVLLACLAAYLVWAYRSEVYADAPAGEMHRDASRELVKIPRSTRLTLVTLFGGLGLLIGGSQVLIRGAVGVAEGFGVSEAMIGLTVVAVGTSLPELTISVIATVRRHADVAVGNVLGSNIFNLLGIAGFAALLQPLPVHDRILVLDQWVMLGSALLLFVFLAGHRMTRLKGVVLLAGYAAYLGICFTGVECP